MSTTLIPALERSQAHLHAASPTGGTAAGVTDEASLEGALGSFLRRFLGDGPVLSFRAGDGHLLSAWRLIFRCGIEEDPHKALGGRYEPLVASPERGASVLSSMSVKWGLVTSWAVGVTDAEAEVGRMMSVCAPHGLCVFVFAEKDRAAYERTPAYRDHLLVEAKITHALLGAPDGVVVAIVGGPKKARRTGRDPERLDAVALTDLASLVGPAFRASGAHVVWNGSGDAAALSAAQKLISRRRQVARGQKADLHLHGGRIRFRPMPAAQYAMDTHGTRENLKTLNGQSETYFAINTREWRRIMELEGASLVTVCPDAKKRIERLIADARDNASPLDALRPQQRLAFLGDDSNISCKKSDPAQGFVAGESYPISVSTQVVTEEATEMREGAEGPYLTHLLRKHKELAIKVGDFTLRESPDSIRYLIDHFTVPDPGDVSTVFPADYARMLGVLDEIAGDWGITLFPFQRDDLARGLVRGSVLLAHDPGLGKTLQSAVFAEACMRLGRVRRQMLMVCPQDLIPQTIAEYRDKAGVELQKISTLGHAREVAARMRRGEDGWYITHFELLSLVGRVEDRLEDEVLWTEADPKRIGFMREITTRDACPKCHARAVVADPKEPSLYDGTVCRNTVVDHRKVRPCGHVHLRRRTHLGGRILAPAFRKGIVIIDEMTLAKGDNALRSKAIRGLMGRVRLGLTGTPMENIVADCFWLLWWVAGSASPRFPYDTTAKGRFVSDFQVIEQVLQEGKRTIRSSRALPQVTNLSALWRLLSGVVLRRRKRDTGVSRPVPVFYPVTVPFGESQRIAYEAWLKGFSDWFAKTHPEHPLVVGGMTHAWSWNLGARWKLQYATSLPEADPHKDFHGEDVSNFTPKNLAILERALSLVEEGKQVLIGTRLVEASAWLCERLQEAGVNAAHLSRQSADGGWQSLAPLVRARRVLDFREKKTQVLVTGVGALTFGHNLDTADACILGGFPDTPGQLQQFLDRIDRLSSKNPVSVYVVMTDGSVDTTAWDTLGVKKGATDLALDGELDQRFVEKIDWEKVLEELRRRGCPVRGNEVSERSIERAWNRRVKGAQVPVVPAPATPRTQSAPPAVGASQPPFGPAVSVSFEVMPLF